MSSALLGVAVLCLCSSSAAGAGAYFYNRKDAKYYENEINLLVNKIIETGARPAQCKLLRDFITENVEDMEEKGTTFPVKGTPKEKKEETVQDKEVEPKKTEEPKKETKVTAEKTETSESTTSHYDAKVSPLAKKLMDEEGITEDQLIEF